MEAVGGGVSDAVPGGATSTTDDTAHLMNADAAVFCNERESRQELPKADPPAALWFYFAEDDVDPDAVQSPSLQPCLST